MTKQPPTPPGEYIPDSATERAPEGYQQGELGQIHEIRQGKARCNTCGQPASAPFRHYDARGAVLYGCIDAFHTGRLVQCSESSYWHNRPEAKKLRQARLAEQKALGKRTRGKAAQVQG
jgi:hypothetical protein